MLKRSCIVLLEKSSIWWKEVLFNEKKLYCNAEKKFYLMKKSWFAENKFYLKKRSVLLKRSCIAQEKNVIFDLSISEGYLCIMWNYEYSGKEMV